MQDKRYLEDRNSQQAQAEPVRQIVLLENLDSLDACIRGLRQRIDTLEDRLQPVLGPVPENQVGAPNGITPKIKHSPVVDRVETQRAEIEHLINRIGYVIDSLDL